MSLVGYKFSVMLRARVKGDANMLDFTKFEPPDFTKTEPPYFTGLSQVISGV